MALGALRLIDPPMEVGDHMIEEQQEPDAQPEAHEGGQKGPAAHGRVLIDGRDDEAPDGRRHHDPRRKAGEGPLDADLQILLQAEHASGARRRAQEGDQQPPQDRPYLHPNQPFFSQGAEEIPRQV